MAAEVRVLEGTQGFQTTKKAAEEYVKTHPEATITELRRSQPTVRATATEPEPEPTPEPTPEPEPTPTPSTETRRRSGAS